MICTRDICHIMHGRTPPLVTKEIHESRRFDRAREEGSWRGSTMVDLFTGVLVSRSTRGSLLGPAPVPLHSIVRY